LRISADTVLGRFPPGVASGDHADGIFLVGLDVLEDGNKSCPSESWRIDRKHSN